MFARIAPTYDRLNRLLSLRRDVAWRRSLVRRLRPGPGRVLDLCAGTGDLALMVGRSGRSPGGRVHGSDFCLPMLEWGVRKRGLARHAHLTCADALRLPYASGSFETVLVAFGLRNFENLEAGLGEIARVTAPGGQLLALEFFPGSRGPVEPFFRFYFHRILPLVGRLVSRDREAYRYLPSSVGGFPDPESFASLLREHGYARIDLVPRSFGVATLVTAEKSPSSDSLSDEESTA
jgi:demethylmenaquinone methyltransferase/2-methoxy-6-polyprenyl-1,4-benzoquinol methylase